MNNKYGDNKKNSFRKIIDTFLENIEILEIYVNTASDMIFEHTRKNGPEEMNDVVIKDIFNAIYSLHSKENNDQIIEKINELNSTLDGIEIIYQQEEEGRKLTFRVGDEGYGRKFIKSMEHIKLTAQQLRMIYTSSLINLAVYMELLINNLIRERLYRYPQAAQLEKKSLTLAEIKEIGGFEEAIDYLIEKELTDLMHNGFRDWLKYFENNMKINLDRIKPFVEEVNEALCRRNLFVHGGGVVNNIYLTKVDRSLTTGIEKGEILIVDKEYILQKINVFRAFGILLGAEVWKSMEKNSKERDEYLHRLTFDLLTKDEWELCSLICDLIIKDRVSERSKWIAQINYWQCMKWLGKFEQVRSDIEKADLSALTMDFQLCKFALLDENDKFFKLLPLAYPRDIDLDDLENWPILREIRKDDRFQKFLESVK